MFIFAGFYLIFGAKGKNTEIFAICENSHCNSAPVHYFVSQINKKILKKKKNLRTCEFSQPVSPPFCFSHNFFIRTPFYVFLVPLEILESVESK